MSYKNSFTDEEVIDALRSYFKISGSNDAPTWCVTARMCVMNDYKVNPNPKKLREKLRDMESRGLVKGYSRYGNTIIWEICEAKS